MPEESGKCITGRYCADAGRRGSQRHGRSTENYSMYENMCGCAELFTKFGGHPMAAGLSLPEENVEKFRRKINENCPLTVEEVCPDIHMTWPCRWDMRVRNWSISLHFWSRLEKTIHLHCCRPESVHQPHVVDRKEPECSSDECSFGIRTAGSGYFLWGCGDVFAYFTEKFGQKEVENRCMAEKTGFYFLWCTQQRLIFIREMKICSWR